MVSLRYQHDQFDNSDDQLIGKKRYGTCAHKNKEWNYEHEARGGNSAIEAVQPNQAFESVYCATIQAAYPTQSDDEGHEHDGVAHFILRQLLHFEPLAGDAVCTGDYRSRSQKSNRDENSFQRPQETTQT